VYAKPGVMGQPRGLADHREAAEEWRNARTKKEQARVAQSTGVKYSVLLQLDYWNPIRHVVVDSLHCFWLGICRTLMKKWRDNKWASGKALDTMQKRLNAMRVPPHVCRLLNKWASNMSGLTGHQVKAFVGCFSLVVYEGFLDEKESKLWNHLVKASRILSAHALTADQIDQVCTSGHR